MKLETSVTKFAVLTTNHGMSYTIVGVIGHIDHGKTSLVAALTGTDTDTHPEEKRRGITIDLGFAAYTDGDHRFALIDAPGHQKYIGNLLAGVSSVDLGLLVVACDQGIQAQTLEHAAILQSLGVSELIVAMSRSDLVEESKQEELGEELDLFLADYGFLDIPKVAVSSLTGVGLDELRNLLNRGARVNDRGLTGNFRMPIDRIFTIEGRGCVVAGTPWSGQVAVGDLLQLSRTGQIARVRGLEVHGDSVDSSQSGLRTAMNLAGISTGDIQRGDELLTENSLQTTRRLVVELKMFQETVELRCPAIVQLHTATTSCSARILGVKRLRAGEQAVVVIETVEPIVASYRQQFLLRRPYPIGSFAGGRVLAAMRSTDRKTTASRELGVSLLSSDAVDRLAAWVHFRSELVIDSDWAQSQLGIGTDSIQRTVDQSLQSGSVTLLSNRLVSRNTIERAKNYVLKVLIQHAESGEDAWLDEESLVRRASSVGSPCVIHYVIEKLVEQAKLVRVNRMVSIASEQTVLSKKQRSRMAQILEIYEGLRTPPTIKELANQIGTSIDAVQSLVRFATQQRILIDLGNGFFIAHTTWMAMLRELEKMLEASPELSVSEIRTGWTVTRKHAIPMLEYCDRNNLTIRDQDKRTRGPALGNILESKDIRAEVKPTEKEQTLE